MIENLQVLNEDSLINELRKDVKVDSETSKTITGYASFDKPWLKFFSKESIESELPKDTLISYLRENSLSHLDTTAIKYYGNNISYKKMLENFKKVAQAYKTIGIKEGDSVAFCLPTLPESIYSFYSLNGLGAVSCWIDPRTGANRIKESINAADAKALVTIDLARPKIDKIVEDTSVNAVISLPAAESLPYGLKYFYKSKEMLERFLKKHSYKTDFIDWNSFIKGRDKDYTEIKYSENFPASIVYTSGTTSKPKGVIISNDALNSVAHQYAISGVPHEVGDKFLNVMPTFLLYGLTCGIHMPLSLGMTDIVIPQVNFDEFGKLTLKEKPAFFMINPLLFDNLAKEDVDDLSFIKCPGIGGSAISVEDEERYNDFLKKKGCKFKLAKGYGATEGGSALVAVLSNECDKLGSAGIPLPKDTISVFKYELDSDSKIKRTDQELKYGEEGEICVTGPSLMDGYLKNEELTNEVLFEHSDGKKWLHTGDRGYIDEDGNVFVFDRIGRMIITPGSHNIYLESIEEVISKHPAIDKCAVVGVSTSEHENGKIPKAVIVLKEEYRDRRKEVVDQLIDMCNDKLPERDVAQCYEIVDFLPVTPGMKIDYKKLEDETIGEFFDAGIVLSDLVKEKSLKR